LRGRQLDKLRRGLRTQQLIDVVEGGASVGTDDLDELVIIICRMLGSGVISEILVSTFKKFSFPLSKSLESLNAL